MIEIALLVGGFFALLFLFIAFRSAYTLGKIQEASETAAAEMKYLRFLIERGGGAGGPPPPPIQNQVRP